MTEFSPEQEASETQPVQVDAYGVRTEFELKPGSDFEEHEIKFKELMRDIRLSLTRALRDSVGLMADLATGGRKLVRGFCAIPDAVAERIKGAHKSIEQSEAKAQGIPNKAASMERLVAKIEELQARGIPVDVSMLGDTTVVIGVVRPENRQDIENYASDSFKHVMIESMLNHSKIRAFSDALPSPKESYSDEFLDRQMRDAPLEIFGFNDDMIRELNGRGVHTIGELIDMTKSRGRYAAIFRFLDSHKTE